MGDLMEYLLCPHHGLLGVVIATGGAATIAVKHYWHRLRRITCACTSRRR